jgi:acyl CoA:acetate/3-ketoacid CoA transferase beta subunit
VTDIAVISVVNKGFKLLETAPGWSADDVQKETDAILMVSDSLKEIQI